jgi:hypothetical protein
MSSRYGALMFRPITGLIAASLLNVLLGRVSLAQPVDPSSTRIEPVAPSPSEAASKCGDGLYLEPSLLTGFDTRGDALLINRLEAGYELHACSGGGGWRTAIRLGLESSAVKVASVPNFPDSGVGLVLEVDRATTPTARLGVRVAVESQWGLEAGVRYRIDDVAFGVDLVSLSSYGTRSNAAVVDVTLGGKPGHYVVAAEFVAATVLVLYALSQIGGR